MILKIRGQRKAAWSLHSDLACLDTDIQAITDLQKLNETHAEHRLSFCRIGSPRMTTLVVRW